MATAARLSALDTSLSLWLARGILDPFHEPLVTALRIDCCTSSLRARNLLGMTMRIHVRAGRVKWRGAVATSVLLGLGSVAGGTAIGQAGSAASDAQTRTY